MIRKITKIFTITLASLVVSISAWLWWGSSLDADFIDRHELIEVAKQIQPIENAFTDLAYLAGNNGIEVIEANDIQLINSIYDGKWDKDQALILTEKYGEDLDVLRSASLKPYFKTPPLDNDNFINYSGLTSINKLAVIQSRLFMEVNDPESATKWALTSLRYSKLLKSDLSPSLIAYMIGIYSQHISNNWVHRLVSNYMLSDSQLKSLANQLNISNDFPNDGFPEVYSGEFDYSISVTNAQLQIGFSERWSTIFSEQYSEFDQHWLLKILHLIAPNYFFHRNTSTSNHAIGLRKLQVAAQKGCSYSTNEPSNTEVNQNSANDSWLLQLRPNAIGIEIFGAESDPPALSSYGDYLHRRCFNVAYFQAVRAIVAIKRFQLVTNNEPNDLSQLSPEYLPSLPVDPLLLPNDTQPLRFNADKRWLYSFGMNRQDGGGSANSTYQYRCYKDNVSGLECQNNPTFPIDIGLDATLMVF